MLVLTRKPDETLILELPQGTVQIMVVSIEGGRAKLGISAPASVNIRRGELAPRYDPVPVKG